MRYATIVFMRVLSGLLSGGIILPERRNVLIQAWKEASGSQDSQKAKELRTWVLYSPYASPRVRQVAKKSIPST